MCHLNRKKTITGFVPNFLKKKIIKQKHNLINTFKLL